MRCILYPYGAMQVYYSHGSKPKIRDPKSLLCTEGAIHIQAGPFVSRTAHAVADEAAALAEMMASGP